MAVDVEKLTEVFEPTYPGLGKFLLAIAHKESRFNPSAGPSTLDNKARGLFGMRPKSARLPLRQANTLLDPVEATARAVDYARRLQAPQWGATDYWSLARGWAFPYLTKDYTWKEARSQEVASRMAKTLEKVSTTAADLDQKVPRLPDYFGALNLLRKAGFESEKVTKTKAKNTGLALLGGLAVVGGIGVAVVLYRRKR